jgi:DNA-binding protein
MAEQPTTPEENVVYIGKKPAMNYVLAVVTQFNNGAKKVAIKARGKMISRAVDVVEIVRNRFVTNAKIAGVELKTEEVTNEDGTKAKVSAIAINLELPK